MIRADFLFPSERERIVRGRDRTVVMLPTGRCLAFALDEAIKHNGTHDTRSFFGGLAERFLVASPILHSHYRSPTHVPLAVSDPPPSHCPLLLPPSVSHAAALQP